MNDFYLKLAKLALNKYLASGKTIDLPDNCPEELKQKQAGAFVSFHKDDELRGCIGTFMPTKPCLGEEIISCAIAAGQDPRFAPINQNELPELKVKVDVLSTPKKAEPSDFNPKIYGVIVATKDGRKGLLLPDLEGVETVEQQIEICRQKGGIAPDEPVELYRFTVERHE